MLTFGCLIILGWIPPSLGVGTSFGEEAERWLQEVRTWERGTGKEKSQSHIHKQAGGHCEQMGINLLGDSLRHIHASGLTQWKHWEHGVCQHTLVPQCFRVAPWSVNSQVLLGHPQSLASSLLLEEAPGAWDEKLAEHTGTAHHNYRWTLDRVKGK